ncbi:MAG: aconitate hydratase AcnA [Gammaproteobacteria bacterium]|nr:aconitate hydratase AcnA [Gammaproteobacteria bacterium]
MTALRDNARSQLAVGDKQYDIFRLDSIEGIKLERLPYSLKILLENLLRHEDGVDVAADDIQALANWQPKATPSQEIAFTPSRVIMQDFTGVPAVVDLAAMRDAIVALGGKADAINPLAPAELVIDHSVQVDSYGRADALDVNNKIEFQRNRERYAFLRWGQNGFSNFKVVPPNTGIVHQVNLEYLARVVFDSEIDGRQIAYPDTLVGTDSHTTMINGLGVLGWGVGGIEAEAAMLGQAITMLIPQVVGVRLIGTLPEGATATDLVLTVTELMRETGVVGKFVEFFGSGIAALPLADRATLGNMSPEFGSTCAIFPIDEQTLRYMDLSGRDQDRIRLVEAYAKEQTLWQNENDPDPEYSQVVELDLATVVPSIAGPKRPQDRIALRNASGKFASLMEPIHMERGKKSSNESRFEDEGGDTAVGASNSELHGADQVSVDGEKFTIKDGAVLIAAITSCTNTSNPDVMLAAGLLARNARAKGLTSKPWVKTSLAPGSRVVTNYLQKAGLDDDLEALGFHTVGYGCTTCIGNSGPLRPEISAAVTEHDIVGCSVLSGNRNFEGRIHQNIRMNFLASPPLVVAYALAGNMDVDLYTDSLGDDKNRKPVYLKDIWPKREQIQETVMGSIDSNMFKRSYDSVFAGDDNWNGLEVPAGEIYQWDEASTYVRNPPYFVGMSQQLDAIEDIEGARCIALLGDTVTTDHISPAGSIAIDSPAAQYLQSCGVEPKDFNSYGSRRGNHEVMMRGTFANIRLRNQLAPGTEGGWTTHIPSGEQMSIYAAAQKYAASDTPLVVIAGSEYGTGSSRDWAAKGTLLLGIKAVLTTSFERIHRSNLIGMGVLPLQFMNGDNAVSLGLTGKERYSITGLDNGHATEVSITATSENGGQPKSFTARVRIDTPKERDYYRNGGILHYVLRQIASTA